MVHTPTLNEKILQVFQTGIKTALEGLELGHCLGEVQSLTPSDQVLGETAAIMPLAGQVQGVAALSFSEGSLEALAAQLEFSYSDPEEAADSLISEILNILMGQAQMGLDALQLKFDFAIPSLVKGSSLVTPLDRRNSLPLVDLQYSLKTGGDLYLQLPLILNGSLRKD